VAFFVLRRVAWAGVMALAVTLVTFVIFFVLPAQPLGRGQIGTEDVAIRDAFPFEGPVYEEYAEFVKGMVVDGSLGRSLSNRRPVAEILAERAPVTLSLVLGGLVLMLLVAIPIGLVSALRPRSLFDRAGMVFVIVGVSLHPAWVGLILAHFFGYKWQLTPLQGYCDAIDPGKPCGGPAQWAYHLLLPWVTFALIFAAMYARMIRASVLETLGEDYVLTARAKGASERRVLHAHVLRNAVLPIVTMFGMDAVAVSAANVIFIERVFALPGLGGMMLEGLTRRDPPLVLGVVVAVGLAVVLFSLVVDLLYGVLDPRVRDSARARAPRLGRGGLAAEPAPLPAEAAAR
jgi:peptide/nickel transport system permease protein